MKILLTGATGFVGKALYEKLSPYHEIYMVGRRKDINNNYIFWDFSKEMPSNLPVVDTIIHTAQSRYYKLFPEKADDMFNVNVASTTALLSYAAKSGVKNFILFSSGSVYEPYNLPIKESENLAPSSYYAINKYASELISLCYQNIFRVCIFRLFVAYGPGQTDRLFPDLINRVRSNIPVSIIGEEGIYFSPIYIDDIVNITEQALDNQWKGIINMASPEFTSIKKVSDLIAQKMNKNVIYSFHDKAAKPSIIVPNIDILKSVYFPFQFTSLEDGITKTLNKDEK